MTSRDYYRSVLQLLTTSRVVTSQCMNGRRIGALTELHTEIGAWSDKTNTKQRGVDWQFRIENARVKLKRLYPKIKV